MSIPRLSVGRPVAVAMLALAIAFLGLISFERLPIDLLPDIAYPRLVVHTSYPGVGPTEVERFVSERVEQAVARVPGVQEVRSVSREGVSLVSVRFAWGTDMDFAALNVRERLDNLRGSLPELAGRPTVLRTDPRAEPIMAVSVTGGGDLWATKQLAESVLKRRLEQIDGIAQAAVTGGLEREIHVEVEPRLLEAHRLTVDELARAIDAANAAAPGGTILRGRYRYPLRTLGEFGAVAEIGEVVVRGGGTADAASRARDAGRPDAGSPGAAVLRVRDVATVRDGFRERESLARSDGREAVGLLLFKDAGANTAQAAALVDGVLAELAAEYPDLGLRVSMSQAEFVRAAIDSVVQNLLLGAALAFLVLLFFLRNPRYPIAVALAIPLSVLATFSLLDAAGVSLNIMSLGGLALGVGMLVDNSIVVLENIVRHKERGLAPAAAAALGAEEVQGAITASTLTTIAVFGPILYVEGVAGELLGALSAAVAFALIASLLVALTVLPTMAARWGTALTPLAPLAAPLPVLGEGRDSIRGGVAGRTATDDAETRGPAAAGRFARFADRYETALLWSLNRRGLVLGLAALSLVVAIVAFSQLERSVLPAVDQGAFRARIELPRGTPLEVTAVVSAGLEAALLADPGVEAVLARVGRQGAVGGLVGEESGLHTALLEVRLREGVATRDALERLAPAFAALPPGALALETGRATALGQLLGSGEADIAVRVRGDDGEAAQAYARTLETRLRGVPSLANVRVGYELGQPEVQLEVDRERAAAFGIEPRAVARTVEALFRGTVATEFVDFDRKIPVVVRLPDAARSSLETMGVLYVGGVPLRELVRARDALGPVEIRRLDQGRVLPVLADVGAGGLERAIADARAVIARDPPPAGLRVEIGGENEEMRRSFRELAFAFGLALFLVYMILAAKFESFLRPFIILLAVPLAAVGAALALLLSGAGLNTMSLIGLIVLVGIVDNDAVVKIEFIEQARRRGLSVRNAVLAAGRARLRPIIMTTLTTLFGVAPMAFGFGRGVELRAPLAIAVFGGLLSATLLTLIVIPVFYEAMEDVRVWLTRRNGEFTPESTPDADRGWLSIETANSPQTPPQPRTAAD
jgi:hydrophobic/amphiphilic exporter-1 (mainly G- bacteria), HAE1 family